jgi:hypothetical protein
VKESKASSNAHSIRLLSIADAEVDNEVALDDEAALVDEALERITEEVSPVALGGPNALDGKDWIRALDEDEDADEDEADGNRLLLKACNTLFTMDSIIPISFSD